MLLVATVTALGVMAASPARGRAHPVKRPAPPWVITMHAHGVTSSAAKLIGRVDPDGHPTRLWFQYGSGRRYGARTRTQSTRSVRRRLSISAVLKRLKPFTTYHYRLVATNCHGCRHGTAYGDDASFTTGGYRNPVYSAAEAPDPSVLDDHGTHHDYWAYTTGNLFPILHSTDLVHWKRSGTAFTRRPAWALRSGDWHPWGPNTVDVRESCPGTHSRACYVMYYAALSSRYKVNCVAVATATKPQGPYTDRGPLSGEVDAEGRPIGCGDNHGYGMIDPSAFVDPHSGQRYLYVSEDFSCPPASTSCTAADGILQPTISVIPISSDYMTATGPRTPLFSGVSRSWESATISVPTVEGPATTFHDGVYYLLYSGGNWRIDYGVGYATSSSPTGPFAKSPANPILSQTRGALSTGGGGTPVIGPHGGSWFLYHGRSGSYANPRTLRLDPFRWRRDPPAPDVPVIAGPTTTPQSTQP